MAMPEVHRRLRVADVLAFPEDGNRYELLAGALAVTAAPTARHQKVVGRIQGELYLYLKALGLADALYPAPADISWNDQTLVQPDLLVVHPDEISDSWGTFKHLLLAVEVISPASARRDRVQKRRLYQEHQVSTYWVVDPDARLVEVWRPGDERPLIAVDTLTWQVLPDQPPLTLDLTVILS